MILLLDNVDSFVHNLERYFVRLGQETQVVRAAGVTATQIRNWQPAAMVFSPGPGAPSEHDPAIRLIREFWQTVPMLGVCLGHQQVAFALGASIERAPVPVHGRASAIHHDGLREFRALPQPFVAARYHSLVTPQAVPDSLEVSARTDDGVVMGIRAKNHAVFGWQFHPESILTSDGFELLRGFLGESGLSFTDAPLPAELPLSHSAPRNGARRRSHPITF